MIRPRHLAFVLVAGVVGCARAVPAPKAAPPTEVRSTPASPPTCHWNAFQTPPTPEELDNALAKLRDLEAAVNQTFDEGAKKPRIVGTPEEVLGKRDWRTDVVVAPGMSQKLVDEAKRRDHELRAIRPTALVSARALFDIGEMYEALAASFAAWTPSDDILTPEQQAKLKTSTLQIQNQVLDAMKRTAATRLLEVRPELQANAYIAYLGVLHLVSMAPPDVESKSYRQRASERVRALSKVANVNKATTSLHDPTSTESDCPLLLGPPEDYR